MAKLCDTAPVIYEKQIVRDLVLMRAVGVIPVDTSKTFANDLIKYTEGKAAYDTEFAYFK